jgi:oxygen-independent coproporphyrinogen-3 oxidase
MARRAGFRNVSIDLIHGLPHDAPDRLKRDLEAIASLAPEHVSVYELTIEPKTRFARLRAQDLLPTVDEERLVSETERIESSLEAIGIRRYEVSNYARAGAEAVHNAAYWRGDEYLGLGVGAHSFSWDAGRGIRRENTRSIRRYLADPAEAADRVETLEETELLAELILVGMRTSRGIDLVGLARMFPKAVGRLPPLVDEWVKRGLATADGTWVKPTSRGLLVADNFASDAIDVLCDG